MSISKALTVNLYNFTGVTIENILFGGQLTGDANLNTKMISLKPNTPDTPLILVNGGAGYSSYYLQMKVPSSSTLTVTETLRIPVDAGTISIYFVNNNGINYYTLLPNGGDIAPYLYSNGYKQSDALITYGGKYAPAMSYPFAVGSYVIAVPANKNIAKLDKVDAIDWTDDGSSYWWILILVIVIVVVVILIAVAVGIAYKMRTKDLEVVPAPMLSEPMTLEPMTTRYL